MIVKKYEHCASCFYIPGLACCKVIYDIIIWKMTWNLIIDRTETNLVGYC